MKDLPQTNYSLLKLQQMIKTNESKVKRDKKEAKDIIDKFKDASHLLEIEESIQRDNPPNLLILHGIYGNELVYKEEQDYNHAGNVMMYSINSNSIFRYLGYTERSESIAILRKSEN